MPSPPETPTERRRRLARDRLRRYREAHRDELIRDRSPLREYERQRSQQRREQGNHADNRDQRQRSQQRREQGNHDNNRDQRQRSQQRRVQGTHADTRGRNRLRGFSMAQPAAEPRHPFVAAGVGLQQTRPEGEGCPNIPGTARVNGYT